MDQDHGGELKEYQVIFNGTEITLRYCPILNHSDYHCALHSVAYELTGYPYLGTPLAVLAAANLEGEREYRRFYEWFRGRG